MHPQISLEHIPNIQIGIISGIDSDHENSPLLDNKPEFHSMLYYVEEGFRRAGIKFHTTKACKHQGSCVGSILVSSSKSMAISYLIRSSINLLLALKRNYKDPVKIVESFFTKDSARFGFFIFAFLAILRTIVCYSRRQSPRSRDKYCFMLGGFLAGTTAALILEKKTRQTLGLFLIARAMHFTYRSLVVKKKIPELKYYNLILFSFSMLLIGGIGYITEPASISQQLLRLYFLWTDETGSEQLMRSIWVGRKNLKLNAAYGTPLYDPLDYMPNARRLLETAAKK